MGSEECFGLGGVIVVKKFSNGLGNGNFIIGISVLFNFV